MSTDATQIMQQPNSATPPPAQPPDQVAVIAAQVSAAVTPVALKAATDLVTQARADLSGTIDSAHTASLNLITDVDNRATAGIAANSQAIQDALGSIGATLETKLKTDPKIQSVLILGTVGALLVGALIILGFDLAGSHQAATMIGWAAGMFGTSVVGIITHELGLLGTTQAPTPVVIPTPVTTTTTVGATS
jgi:hypothetical protein